MEFGKDFDTKSAISGHSRLSKHSKISKFSKHSKYSKQSKNSKRSKFSRMSKKKTSQEQLDIDFFSRSITQSAYTKVTAIKSQEAVAHLQDELQ